jgi:hypothetical protein
VELQIPCVHQLPACKKFGISNLHLFNPVYFTENISRIYNVEFQIPPFNSSSLISKNISPFRMVELNTSKKHIPNIGMDGKKQITVINKKI